MQSVRRSQIAPSARVSHRSRMSKMSMKSVVMAEKGCQTT